MATYYVDTNNPIADDSNSGSENYPWKTIQRALNGVVAGDTVYIKGGIYYQPSLVMTNSGTAGNPITISNFGNDVVIIDFSSGSTTGWNWNGYKNYIIINGLQIRNSKGTGLLIQGSYNQIINNIIYNCGLTNKLPGITIRGGSYCQIHNNDIYNCGSHGIYIETVGTELPNGYTNNNIISSNKIHNNPENGVGILPNPSMSQIISSNNIIKQNKIYANNKNGIYLRYQDNIKIFSNLIYNNLEKGVFFDVRNIIDGPLNAAAFVINNTIVFNDNGIQNNNVLELTLKNNILAYNRSFQIAFGILISSPFISNFNLYYSTEEKIAYFESADLTYRSLIEYSDRYNIERSGIEEEPSFVNINQDNFKLQNNSSCINAGEEQSSEYSIDILGTTRPQGLFWDIGAYEYLFPQATNYYIDNAAKGNNTGLSWENAWTSFNFIEWNLLKPGSILHVSGGNERKVYKIQSTVSIAASGITIQKSEDYGHNGEVILDCNEFIGSIFNIDGKNDVTIKNFTIDGGTTIISNTGVISVKNCLRPKIIGCKIILNKGYGISFSNINDGIIQKINFVTTTISLSSANLAYLSGGNNNIIEKCSASITNDPQNQTNVINVLNETNSIIRQNRIYITTPDFNYRTKYGIYCLNNNSVIKIFNNLVVIDSNADNGAGISFNTDNIYYTGTAQLYHNTVIINKPGLYAVEIKDTVENNTDVFSKVENNIFYVNDNYFVAYYPTSFFILNCDYNIYFNTGGDPIKHANSTESFISWQNKNMDTNGYFSEPTFSYDYKLKRSSIGVDNGKKIEEVLVDIDDVKRPQGNTYDIGAYETRKGYYVDCETENTVKDGNSWSTAWSSFSEIDWDAFTYGDSLYISGGPENYSKIYYEQLNVGASGISILPGLDNGHNGQVIIDGLNLIKRYGIYNDGYNDITISGLILRNAYGTEIFSTKANDIKIYDCNILFYGRGIDIRYGSNCVISGCTMYSPPFIGAETDGIYIQDSINSIIEANNISVYNSYIDGENDCIQIVRNYNSIIRNNYCIQNTNKLEKSRGIYGSDCNGTIYIYNNVVNMNDTISIAIGYENLTDGTADVHIYNNTIFGKKIYNGILVSNVNDPKIKNNILKNKTGHPILSLFNWNGNTENINYNIYDNTLNNYLINFDNSIIDFSFWQGYSFDSNSKNQDPKFVNEDTGNLQLQNISPAKNAGISLSGLFNYDINYVTRPYENEWDIGAFEGPGFDITKPYLIKAEILNANSIKLIFSERLIKRDAEKPENYSISKLDNIGADNPLVITATYDDIQKIVFLYTSTHTYGRFSVKVENVKDLAGNTIDLNNNSSIYEYYYVDNTPPKLVSATLVEDNLVRLNFDEELNLATAQNIRNYTINNRIIYAAIYNSEEGTVLLLTDTHTYGYYTVEVNNVTDLAGNLIDNDHKTASYSKIYQDTVPPKLINVFSSRDGDYIDVTFSESILSSSLEDLNNYNLSSYTFVSSFILSQWNDKVRLYLNTPLVRDNYTLTVTSGIRDLSNNPIDPNASSFNFYHASYPAIINVDSKYISLIDVYFSRPMNVDTLLDPEHYNISGPSIISVQNVIVHTNTFITLKTTRPTVAGNYNLEIRNAYDTYNILLESPYNSMSFEITGDFDPPNLVAVELLSANTLKLVFDEKINILDSQYTDLYNIRKLTVSGYLPIYSVYVSDNLAYLTTALHNYMHNYSITVSGIKDLNDNIMISEQTINYIYNVSGLSLDLLSPLGGETFYNGQHKPIQWYLDEK